MARPTPLSRLLLVGGIVGGAVVVLVVGAFLVERLLWRGDVMVGVRLAGAQVADRPVAEAGRTIATAAADLERSPLNATADGEAVPIDPVDVKLDVDHDATLEAVRKAGRSGNPLAQVIGVIGRRVRPIEVEWRHTHDDAALSKVVAATAKAVDRSASNGSLRFAGGEVTPVEPKPGRKLDQPGSATTVADRLVEPERRPFALPVLLAQPAVDKADVEAAAAKAEPLLAEPLTVSNPAPRDGPPSITLTPEKLASALEARPAKGALALGTNAKALRAALGADLARWETEPVDARFAVSGGKVTLVPAKTGRRLDTTKVGAAIVAGENPVEALFAAADAELTTGEAKQLGIKERISTFTTNFPPGQPRVRNIERAVAIMDGTLIRPGKRFSLNEVVGPRTVARGFVEAPVIFQGEFDKDIGGGVSQVSTTTFNAAFFAGVPLNEYKAHTFYISRYPMGREATISLPAPDMVWTNDYETGILVKAATTPTSVTVSFYGTKDGRKVTGGEPRVLATRPAGVDEVDDPQDVQPPHPGYDVEVFRTITKPGQAPKRERFFTRYAVGNRKVLRADPEE
jgi:vancomycin resistance protein YoaR